MKIGVIGGGKLGGGLAERWRRAGHEVRVSTRDTVTETSAAADVVLLAIWDDAIEEVVPKLQVDGKVLVDATNVLRAGKSNDDVRRLAPGARVVKAFNTNFAALFDRLDAADPWPSAVYCGDDTDAREVVATLIRDAGFEPADGGGLDQAANLEAFAKLIINMAYNLGRGPFFYRFESS
jgi:predicted dinucleotide-binding enzyme